MKLRGRKQHVFNPDIQVARLFVCVVNIVAFDFTRTIDGQPDS